MQGALLADVCANQFRGECAVLVAAVDEGVAAELLSNSSGLPTEVLLGRLSDRLQANRGVSSDLARWGVESWGGCPRSGGRGKYSGDVQDGRPNAADRPRRRRRRD